MKQRKRTPISKKQTLPYLRVWREQLGLTRIEVVEKFSHHDSGRPIDQATLAKWESGMTGLRVQDLKILAEIYGVTPDRLFFSPDDNTTPDLIRKAFEILKNADNESIQKWVDMGELLIKNKN